MPNKNGCYELLDHLYKMLNELQSDYEPYPSQINRLISAALELPELSQNEIDPSSIALQLGHLFYGIQQPHHDLDFRFMPKSEIQPRIATVISTLMAWIDRYESRVRVVTELPKPTKQYTEADTKWINSSHPLYATLPEILTREDWRGNKSQYLLIPGVFALFHNKNGAFLTELVSGDGRSAGSQNHGIEVTKDNCKAFIVALANQTDWPSYIKDLLDEEHVYVRGAVRAATGKLWAYDSAKKLLGLEK